MTYAFVVRCCEAKETVSANGCNHHGHRSSSPFPLSLFLFLDKRKTITMKVLSLLVATLASTASAAHFGGHAAAFAAITPGTKLPAVELHSGFPPSMVNMAEHVAGRKVAIVGLPGAFTPT
jgi:hypothetical protein